MCPGAPPIVIPEGIDCDWYSLFVADDREIFLEGESGRPNQDGQIAAGTLIAGTGEMEHYISQYQPTHDQATRLCEMKKKQIQNPRTFDVRKKRRGTPLDDEEKKERKKIVDQRHRAKAKARNKNIKRQLQDANSKIERRDGALEELNKEKNLTAQKLLVAVTENGKLQNENNGLKDHVRKMKEEVRGLKGINVSLMEGNVTITNDLQIGAYSRVSQQQLVNTFELNNIQGFPVQQEQLGLEDNGRLGFEKLVPEIQSMHSEMLQQANAELEARTTDSAEAAKHIIEADGWLHI